MDMTSVSPVPPTVGEVLKDLFYNPIQKILLRWNWKSALLGAILRSSIYLTTYLVKKEGAKAALGAAIVEFLMRIIVAGITGSMLQAFRKATPTWLAMLTVMIGFPILTHGVEFATHYIHESIVSSVYGTEMITKTLISTFGVSLLFSALSAIFNLFAMKKGALVVGGQDDKSLWADLKQMPMIVFEFITFPFVWIWKTGAEVSDLVLANLRTRPLRMLISVIGVSLGVVLIILFTGLARGMTNDMAKRASNWKAEIVFSRPGGLELTTATSNLSTSYVNLLKEKVEGIAETTPVFKYITPDSKSGFGIKQIDGVDWSTFSKMNDMTLVSGRAVAANDEVILDEREMRDGEHNLNDSISLFGNKTFKIVGVFSPPSGSRTKLSISAMQELIGPASKCTYILVKIKDGEKPETIAARINEIFPGNRIDLTQDLVINADQKVPGLNIFLRALVGLGGFVSTIFVLLSMYTTITERRREIGILKSLGASKGFIMKVIESEAFLIGILGLILGLIVSFLAALIIQREFELVFEFSVNWTITAAVIAILGSLIGALYPALQAASIDPVEVMANE